MRKELVVAALATIALLVFYNSSEQKGDAFQEWKDQYGVTWAPEEEAYRRLIFEKNILEVERHNADNSQTYKKGVNQFTVLTQEEFQERYLTVMPQGDVPEVDLKPADVNADVDWSTKGKVSKVKNQGQCGSCWAFSATGAMESFALFKGQSVSLSEQQLVDCSKAQGNHGCNGGWPSSALKYAIANGMASSSEYPYVARDQTCKKNGGSFKIAGQSSYSGCSGLSNGVQSHPISVAVDANKWSSYKSGVFSSCGTSIDHAVLLVGIVGGNWKIKNSWGTGWGENGYIRLAGTSNTCGICANAGVYPK